MKKRLVFKKAEPASKAKIIPDNACGGGSNACK